MGYLCIIISLFSGAFKGFIGKKISGRVDTAKKSAFVNVLRMAICIMISSLLLLPEIIGGSFVFDWQALVFGIMSGVTLSVFVISWMLAVREGAYTLVSVAQMFGVVVTILCALLVFRDPISPWQILAIGILIISVLVMVSYSKGVKGKITPKAIFLLVLCGGSSGLNDFSMKLFVAYSSANVTLLNLLTFAIAFFFLIGVFVVDGGKEIVDTKELFRKNWFPILLMAACLYLNSYFKAFSNNYFSPVILYPIYQAGGLILSATMSAAFFKEKITPRCIIGLALAFVAILLLK